jgi:hypothetical protein
MRQFLLTFTVLSILGGSQPAPQQPSTQPIVVKVEMPPTQHRGFLGEPPGTWSRRGQTERCPVLPWLTP